MGVTLALLAMLSFASNIIVTRYAVQRMPVEGGFFIVLAVNTLFPLTLFLVSLPIRQAPFAWHWEGALFFGLGGLVGTFLGRRFLFEAVQTLGPARASVFHSTAPAFALIGAWFMVGERLGPTEILLMAVVWLGLWLTTPRTGASPGAMTKEMLRKGMMAGLLTVAGFGFGNVLRGVAMRQWDEAMFGSALASLAATACQILATRDWSRIAGHFRKADRRAWQLYLACGVTTSLGSIFIAESMTHMEIALAVLIVHTTPVVIFPVSVFLMKNREDLAPRTVLGAILVISGIAMLAYR
jgi:drug/metabolite transporter (DMT)-like permease